jgi:hypothetical protein
VFKNLTHLELMDQSVLIKSYICFDTLVELTHLCLVLAPHRCNPAMVKHLISNMHLRVMVFCVEYLHQEIERFMEQHEILD